MIADRVARRYITRMASSESVNAVAHILMASGGVKPDQDVAYETARDLLDKVSDILAHFRPERWYYSISDFATNETVSDSFEVPMRRSGWYAEQHVEVEYPSAFVAQSDGFKIDLDALVPPVWVNVRSPDYWSQLRQAVNAFAWREADAAKYKSRWDGRIEDERLENALYNGLGKNNLILNVKTKFTVEGPDGPVEPREGLDANLVFKGRPATASLKYDKDGNYRFNVVVGLQVKILPPEV